MATAGLPGSLQQVCPGETEAGTLAAGTGIFSRPGGSPGRPGSHQTKGQSLGKAGELAGSERLQRLLQGSNSPSLQLKQKPQGERRGRLFPQGVHPVPLGKRLLHRGGRLGAGNGMRERWRETALRAGTGLHLLGRAGQSTRRRGASAGSQPKDLALNKCWGQRWGTCGGAGIDQPWEQGARPLRRVRGQTLRADLDHRGRGWPCRNPDGQQRQGLTPKGSGAPPGQYGD